MNRAPRFAYLYLIGAALLYVWGSLSYHLSKFWLGDENYQYGWAAPFLLLFLLHRRFQNLPAPSSSPKIHCGASWIAVFAACLLIPTRIVLETNPDWRGLLWWSAGLAIVFTLSLIYSFGGWAWVEHFRFPVLFTLSAVPWPGQIEGVLTTTLMQTGAFISGELLNFCGVVVLQHGSVLETLNGPIGIDEACSGIKSLQTMTLLGLFLSDLAGLSGWNRVIPVFLGWALAFIANLLRITTLALIGTQFGTKALESWHDIAGNIAFVLASVLLVYLGFRPRPKEESLESAAKAWPSSLPSGRLVFPSLLLVILAAAEPLNSWWYHQESALSRPSWSVDWSALSKGAQTFDIAPRTLTALQCDAGSARCWHSGDGRQWIGYFFQWNPGLHALLARGRHSPELCLPATGRTLLRDDGDQAIPLGSDQLFVRHMEFDDNGDSLNVFFIVDGGAVSKSEEALDLGSFKGRLRSVFRHSRQGERRSLELIAKGYPTGELAWKSAAAMLENLIVLGHPLEIGIEQSASKVVFQRGDR